MVSTAQAAEQSMGDARLTLLASSILCSSSQTQQDIHDTTTAGISDAAISGISGAGSGIVALLVTYPLLTATTRQQTASSSSSASASASSSGSASASENTRQDASSQGGNSALSWSASTLTSLYDGLGPALLGTTASQGVYYYFYAYFTRQLLALQTPSPRARARAGARGSETTTQSRMKNTQQLSAGAFLAAAALAGAVNVLLTNPIWLVVTRLQVMRRMKPKDSTKEKKEEEKEELNASVNANQGEGSVAAAVKEVLAESGVAGLWRGVLPSLVMVVNPAISYMLFEMLKKSTQRATPTQGRQGNAGDVSVWSSFVNGALAKLGATVVTYPLQLVKSRLQAGVDDDDDDDDDDENDGDNGTASAGTKKGGVLYIVQKILRDEGMQGFYRGISTKICQSVFAAALLFAVQDALKASIVAVLKPPVGSKQRRVAA